jgi:hypothetical protein
MTALAGGLCRSHAARVQHGGPARRLILRASLTPRAARATSLRAPELDIKQRIRRRTITTHCTGPGRMAERTTRTATATTARTVAASVFSPDLDYLNVRFDYSCTTAI